MASVIATPNPARVGEGVTIFGEGFAASGTASVRLFSEGMGAEVATDSGGSLSSDDVADHAKVTLTAAGNPSNDETVTLGSRVYTFKTTLTGVANEVLIGATASASLDNLKAAVNGAAGSGTTYGRGTVRHADIIAGAKTATTIVFQARMAGTGGNSLASTETSTTALSFGAGTLTGGAVDPTGVKQMEWVPTRPGTFEVVVNDGSTSASIKVQVFQSV